VTAREGPRRRSRRAIDQKRGIEHGVFLPLRACTEWISSLVQQIARHGRHQALAALS
jgi:hypothetical protein